MTTNTETTTQHDEPRQPAELSAEEIAQVGGGWGPNRYNVGATVQQTTTMGAVKSVPGGRSVAS